MKKILLSICALAAVMTSCTKSSVVDAPKADTPIQFTSYSGRTPESKATSVETEDALAEGGGFQVIAFRHAAGAPATYTGNPYMNSPVKKTNETHTDSDLEKDVVIWKADKTTYWLPSNSPDVLDFVAYSLNTTYGTGDSQKNAVSAVTTGAGENTITDYSQVKYTVPEAVADQKDFLVATPQNNLTLGATETGKQHTDGVVNLQFNHVLSRIGFSINRNAGDTREVVVKQVELSGKFYKSGTVNLTSEEPNINTQGVDNSDDVTYSLFVGQQSFTNAREESDEKTYAIYNNVSNAPAKSEENRYMMIIPSDNSTTAAKVSITYTIAGGSDVTTEVALQTTTTGEGGSAATTPIAFVAGKSYNIVMQIQSNEIKFSVAITPWDEPDDNNHTITLS